jgi:acyl transferase domain-containing protein
MMIGLDRGHFLSPTGQCKSFDASADGYSRSEGCGMFVLKRLSDAVAENDNILGIIRGVEVNQSGLAHSITHPHAPTQAALFKRLVENAGVDPIFVNVVEAHGPGTQAGDPCELESIRSILAVNRTAQNPLHITSIKANIGHLEAASGAAGLAKLLLMLQHRTIPRQILLDNLNPKILPLESDHTIINTSQVPWLPSENRRTRFAMLNNFGAAGSNAALLLEEYSCATPPIPPPAEMPFVFGLSAKTESSLVTLRSRYLAWLQSPECEGIKLCDMAYTATARRQVYPYRMAVVARDGQELAEKLSKASALHVTGHSGKVIFVFSGQGSQYPGMGACLYRTCHIFKRYIDECHSFLILSGFADILPIITGDLTALTPLETIEAYQTAVFTLEYALAKLWMSWGIKPAAVVGHRFVPE